MVVVEKQTEQPHIVSRGFCLFVDVAADGSRRAVGARHQAAVELDELEGFDLLRLTGLGHVEVGLRQIRDGVAVLVGDDDVDADEVDAGAEDRAVGRSRLLLSGLGPIRLLNRRGRLLLGVAVNAGQCESQHPGTRGGSEETPHGLS